MDWDQLECGPAFLRLYEILGSVNDCVILQSLEYVPGLPDAQNGSIGWQDDLVGEGTCHQTGQAELGPQDSRGRKNRLPKAALSTPHGCNASMCIHTYTSPHE